LPRSASDEPVRTGRRVTLLDKERLEVVERLFFARPVPSKPNAARGPAPASTGDRRQRHLQLLLALFTEYIGANLNPFCSQVLAGNPRSAISMKAKIVRLRDRYMPGLRPLRD